MSVCPARSRRIVVDRIIVMTGQSSISRVQPDAGPRFHAANSAKPAGWSSQMQRAVECWPRPAFLLRLKSQDDFLNLPSLRAKSC